MASGWTNDDNLARQIDDTINDSVSIIRSRISLRSSKYCVECDELIPLARRKAIVTDMCIGCQSAQDKNSGFGGFNRRACKDALLR